MADDTKMLGYLKRVTADLRRARARLEAAREPVAVVGMACRFPGADTPEELAGLLAGGTDATSGWPTDRGWDIDGLYHPERGRPGRTYVRRGGFVAGAAEFDPAFFGVSPREAAMMDPQQRLFLQICWEAAERAGLDPEGLRGSPVGVFAGVSNRDYATDMIDRTEDGGGYLLTGTSSSVVSGRISYLLGLEGPSLTVDTACSSSLVALHLAMNALRRGECGLALAGGSTVMATPHLFVEYSRQQAVAPDGRSKAFDASADGAGFAEGAGAVLLERLSDARANGHPVLAVLRGSAVNNDGASNGLTAPSGPAQQAVVRAALADAGLEPADIDAVEAHGTGTKLGDPIEAGALNAVHAGRDRPLWLGSIKSNIGHTQSAAGVAGLMKMVLALRGGTLPASLHISRPSPHIDWDSGVLGLLDTARPWPADPERPRRAGISSFGFSGTNAHLIVEEAPAGGTPAAGAPAEPAEPAEAGGSGDSTAPALLRPFTAPVPVPWIVAGRTRSDVAAQAAALRARLGRHAASPAAAAATAIGLAAPRGRLPYRGAVTAPDRAGLDAGLAALAAGREAEPPVRTAPARDGAPAGTVFVFPGQGAQWPGMGAALLERSPVFAARAEEVAAALDPHTGWSLIDVLRGAPGAPELDSAAVVQPALFGMALALEELWRACGVQPDAVVGHSQGEIAAACAAGALSLDDAARLIAVRSQVVEPLVGRGGAAAVAAGPEQLQQIFAAEGLGLSIAAHNSADSCIVVGDDAGLERLAERCAADGRPVRRLAASYPGHGPAIEEVRTAFLERAAGVAPRTADIPLYSTVTAERADGAELDTGYWYRNLREPVRFAPVLRTLAARRSVFCEVSPHPVATGPITAVAAEAAAESAPSAAHDGAESAAVATLRRGDGGPERFTAAVAEAAASGAAFDAAALVGAPGPLPDGYAPPTYAFQTQRYWADRGPVRTPRSGGHALVQTELGRPDGQGPLLSGQFSLRSAPWLADHRAAGEILVPGTALLDLALHAGARAGCPELADLQLLAPLAVPGGDGSGGAGEDGGATEIQADVGAAAADGTRPVRIHARTGGGAWTLHAEGALRPRSAEPDHPPLPAQWPPQQAEPVPLEGAYERLADRGHDYGPAFQGLRALWRDGEDTYAEVALPAGAAVNPGAAAHPALLDAALHTLLIGEGRESDTLLMPFSWEGVRLHSAAGDRVRVRVTGLGGGIHRITLAGADGAPLLDVDAFTVREARPGAAGAARSLYALTWVPPEPAGAAGGGAPPVPQAPAPQSTGWAVLDGAPPTAGTRHRDLTAPFAAFAAGAPAPDLAVAPAPGSGAGPDPAAARAATAATLELVQQWLAEEPTGEARLAVVTRGAAATRPGEGVEDLSGAAAWGMLRSVQTENPGRFVLLDLEPGDAAPERPAEEAAAVQAALRHAVAADEPQLALRDGALLVPRLGTAAPGAAGPAADRGWRLEADGSGRIDGLACRPHPDAERPLGAGEVRIDVHSAGLNFRDVLLTLGAYPEPGTIGYEAAGTVAATGPGVSGLAPGDRVMGLVAGALGPVGVADQRMLARVPDGWTLAEASAATGVYLTAYYALVDTARLQGGERLLVHAAAGGVGLAAVHLGRHLGAEVYATASAPKRALLRRLGIPAERIGDSRSAEFEERLGRTTAAETGAAGSGGVDVVLNSLTGPLADAGLRLLRGGGRFVEIGRNDLRDPAAVEAEHPGTAYLPLALPNAGPERIAEMLADLGALFDKSVLPRLPLSCLPIGSTSAGMRRMQLGRSTGKTALTVQRPLDPGGTVLITGGTGALGKVVVRHLADRYGIRSFVLLSRRGAEGEGVAQLRADMAGAGAAVAVVTGDAAAPADLDRALAAVPADRPLTAVIHSAVVVDDGVATGQTAERADAVLRAKADSAWLLHEKTRGTGLAAFVLFSSAAGVLGTAGQSTYAAANAYLDALAQYRAARGLPATSLSWGVWAERGDSAPEIAGTDLHRFARIGLREMPTGLGMALLDAALDDDRPHFVPMRLDSAALRSTSAVVPPVLRSLLPPAAPAGAAGGAAEGAAAEPAAPPGSGDALGLVRVRAAEVLGHTGPESIAPDASFLELGFDSLTAVELRNRLGADLGRRLPAGLVFAHPTPELLAAHLAEEEGAGGAEPAAAAEREGSPDGAADQPAADDDGAIVPLFLRACREGRAEEGTVLLRAAAALRPSFTDAAAEPAPRPVVLASHPAGAAPGTARLFCFPSLVVISGAHEYARFASALRGERGSTALPNPGFAAGERLPADVGALADLHARTVLREAGGAPFALLGRSSGGWVAHAVALRLQQLGTPPTALVLLDTPGTAETAGFRLMEAGLEARAGDLGLADAARATAAGGYMDLFWGREVEPVAAPILQLRPRSAFLDRTGVPVAGGDAPLHWPLPHDTADVSGDHLSMLEDHADEAAAAVHGHLARREHRTSGATSPAGASPAHGRTEERERA
ncbi:beta-ketoacyl synthase N-terminal-like domain-containing protein [Nocardiopsis coralliicola]